MNQSLPDAHELGEALRRFRDESDACIAEAMRLGLNVDLGPWLTLRHYSEKYGVGLQVLTDWLKQGIIPTDCTLVLPEFNDMRLVRDQVYK